MNRSIVIFFLFFTTVNCNAQIFLKGKKFSSQGFCSTIIEFVNDSLYSSNHGCESSGKTTIGLYELKNDTVLLKPFKTKLIELVKINSSEIKEIENIVQVKVFDQYGKNITNNVEFKSIHNDGRKFRLVYDSTLECHQIRRNCNDEVISCTTYNQANSDELVLDCSKFNSFDVHLNFNEVIENISFKWHDINRNENGTKFIISNTKLTELPGPWNMYLQYQDSDYYLH